MEVPNGEREYCDESEHRAQNIYVNRFDRSGSSVQINLEGTTRHGHVHTKCVHHTICQRLLISNQKTLLAHAKIVQTLSTHGLSGILQKFARGPRLFIQ